LISEKSLVVVGSFDLEESALSPKSGPTLYPLKIERLSALDGGTFVSLSLVIVGDANGGANYMWFKWMSAWGLPRLWIDCSRLSFSYSNPVKFVTLTAAFRPILDLFLMKLDVVYMKRLWVVMCSSRALICAI